MSDSAGQGEQRNKDRVQYEQPVRIRYKLFQDFIQEVSTNISSGGMFIATDEPREPGTMLDFELALEDGFTLVAGRGKVIWVRAESDGVDKPAGMGIEFTELRGTSRRLINTIVDKRSRRPASDTGPLPVAHGPDSEPTVPLALSELDRLGPSEGPDAEPTARLETGAFAASAEPRMPAWARLSILLVVSALVGGLVVLLFHLTWVRPKLQELEQRVESLADQNAQRAARLAARKNVEPEAADQDAAVAEAERGPLDVVYAWASAWSAGEVDEYLGFYADDFIPSGGLSRPEWEALRRTRVARHGEIDVQVLLPEVDEAIPDSAVVRFVQAYTSETYHDRVRKTLRLERRPSGWKIVNEEVVRALPD